MSNCEKDASDALEHLQKIRAEMKLNPTIERIKRGIYWKRKIKKYRLINGLENSPVVVKKKLFVNLFCGNCKNIFKFEIDNRRLRGCLLQIRPPSMCPKCKKRRHEISMEPYGVEFNEKLKEQIRGRDNYVCQISECNSIQNGRKFSIHHIDYDKKNNKPKNLVTLCRSCHSRTNSNRQYWQSYFIQSMNELGMNP